LGFCKNLMVIHGWGEEHPNYSTTAKANADSL